MFGDALRTEAELDRWVAAAAAKAERYQAMQAQVARVSVTESSPDGVVSVTVDAGGTVTDLRITDRVRDMPGAQVAAAVLATMRRAQSGIPERVTEIMESTVGEDTATVQTVVGNYRAKFPEPPPEQPPSASGPAEPRFGDDEEQGWGGQSWLR